MSNPIGREESLAIINRSLLDALNYATTLIEDRVGGFNLDAICHELSKVANQGDDSLDEIFLKLNQSPVEYDGLVGNSWHEIASLWLERLLNFVAKSLSRSCGPALDGNNKLVWAFLPPVFDNKELQSIKIPYLQPRLLVAKVQGEYAMLGVVEQKDPAKEVAQAIESKKVYSIGDLIRICGIKNDTLKKYGKPALSGVWIGRGKRGKQFTDQDAIAIVRAVEQGACEAVVKETCATWLRLKSD